MNHLLRKLMYYVSNSTLLWQPNTVHRDLKEQENPRVNHDIMPQIRMKGKSYTTDN